MARALSTHAMHHTRAEWAEMVEVARLYFEQGLKQTDIAARLHMPQASISRLLRRAAEERIVRHVVAPPPLLRLQADVLAKVRSKGIRDVRVVPRGVGDNADKNVDNLGTMGAEYLCEVLTQCEGDQLTIGMACGDTLVDLMTRFADLVAQQTDTLRTLRAKQITLYPLNLFWGPRLEYNANIYPAVLVIATATLLMKLGCRVVAYAPQPPLSFYKKFETFTEDERDHLIGNYTRYLEEAKRADVFLIGIGIGIQDPKYQRVLEELERQYHLKEGESWFGDVNYQPFDAQGQFIKLPKLLAVTGEELIALAATEKKVIAVAGGQKKIPAVPTLLNHAPPFNALITDEAVAETLLAQ